MSFDRKNEKDMKDLLDLNRHEKIVECLPGNEVVIRWDGFTRISAYWGVVSDGTNMHFVNPTEENVLSICICRKKVRRIRFNGRPYYGDVLLAWKEDGIDDVQFLAIHATVQKAKAVKFRAEVQSRADLNFYMRGLLELGAYISVAISSDKVVGLIGTEDQERH